MADRMTLTWRDRLLLLAPLLAIGLLTVTPTLEDGPTLCPFALCTGMACPGCGMTRAASHLLRGDLGTAIALHPLVPMVGLLAFVGWIWFVLRKTGRVQPLSQRPLNLILIGSAVALLATWAVRLLSGTLPPV